MSVHAISWAYRAEAVADPYEAFLLVTLADQADDWGVLWAQKSTLAAKCRCSSRKVQYALKSLEDAGLILRVQRRRDNGSQRSSAFVLVGWDRRKRPVSIDEHPVLEQLYVAGVLSEATIRAHIVHPDAESTVFSTRKHGVPHPGEQCSPLEPSIDPSKDPYPPTPQLQEAQKRESTEVRSSRSAHRSKPSPGIWDRAFDDALGALDPNAERRADPASAGGDAGDGGRGRGGAGGGHAARIAG